MSTLPDFDPFGPAIRQPRGFANPRFTSPATLVADVAWLAASHLAAFLRRRHDARMLARVDDRILRDIGIERLPESAGFVRAPRRSDLFHIDSYDLHRWARQARADEVARLAGWGSSTLARVGLRRR
jgi:hypothetical protein